MRGRKPQPTVVRLLRNNPGKRKINTEEPNPDQLAVATPEELTDPVAQREWLRAIVPAIERGQITSADRPFAIAHCDLWATWRSQLADAARHAHVIAVGKNKYPQPNPARIMANKTLLLMAKIDAELGFSPSSRTRVKSSPSARPQSKVEQFRRSKHG